MVSEVKLPNCTWTDFSASRIPQILDDEIKGYSSYFFVATKKLTPDESSGMSSRWPSR